ncbi:hypothetical protein NKG94_06020 [Micromonospora sp. M12]
MHNIDEVLDELGLNVGPLTRARQWLFPVDPRSYRTVTARMIRRTTEADAADQAEPTRQARATRWPSGRGGRGPAVSAIPTDSPAKTDKVRRTEWGAAGRRGGSGTMAADQVAERRRHLDVPVPAAAPAG